MSVTPRPTRRFPAGDADEKAMLTGWLDWQRATVHSKCDGLSEADAYRAPLPSSPLMTIAGVVAHLRRVEHGWLHVNFLGQPDRSSASDDLDERWRVSGVALETLLDDYARQCDRSRQITAAHDLDDLEAFAPPGIEYVSLRWILVHVIAETARHLGHLDALRELADGVTGY